MNKTFENQHVSSNASLHFVAGDFALSAIAIRLLAPDPESLLRFLPDAHPAQSIEEWEAFAQHVNWSDEAQSVLYVGNFVHEFVHLIQHTTLFRCMHHIYALHSLAHHTFAVLMELKDKHGAWPPKVPLLAWVSHVDPHEGESLFKEWIHADAYFRLYAGDEAFAEHLCSIAGMSLEADFVAPFNPRVSHLNRASARFNEFNDIPITTRMLLESQATALEYRFLGAFYGEAIAQQLLGGFPQAGIRIDYDVLHLIAINDGMSALFPALIDWAFMGQAYVPQSPPYAVSDYAAYHPAWRFVRLYNAARDAINDGALPQGRDLWSALGDIESLQHVIYERAGLLYDDISYVVEWVDSFRDIPLKAVFQTNIKGRAEYPQAYASFEANLTPIQSWTCAPLVMFRDRPYLHYHPGKQLDHLDQIRLDDFAKRIYEMNRMIEGKTPECPFCVGVRDTAGRKVVPAVGGQAFGVEGHAKSSSTCHCGWTFSFECTWDVSPEDIVRM